MSGHSKWSTIKRKKGALDIQRSKEFTRIAKEISIAAKYGTDVATNPRLRLAIQNAKAMNVPKANIEKAINKSKMSKDNYSSVTYECNGVKNSTYIVECLTDNPTRTVNEIRLILSRGGGSLARSGSVSYNYEKKSFFDVENNNIDPDDILMKIIDYGGEDVTSDEENVYILGDDSKFGELQSVIEECGLKIKSKRICYVPKNTVTLNEEDEDKSVNLINNLECLDDVEYVYHNIDFAEK